MSTPKFQILRPVQITPHGVRRPQTARTKDPFEYELLIPVNGELDEDEVAAPTPTLEFEIDEDGRGPTTRYVPTEPKR